jgi:hypothetical protein
MTEMTEKTHTNFSDRPNVAREPEPVYIRDVDAHEREIVLDHKNYLLALDKKQLFLWMHNPN